MKSYPLQCVSVQMLYLWLFYGWLAIVSRHFFSEHGYIWSIVTGYFINKPAPVDQKVDSAIHWINLYPVDKVIVFANKHPLDNDFSGGNCYPTFERPGPATVENSLERTSFVG